MPDMHTPADPQTPNPAQREMPMPTAAREQAAADAIARARAHVAEHTDNSASPTRPRIGSTALKFYVCGLSHVRADLATRERFALSAEQAAAFARELKSSAEAAGEVCQALVLSTCNRTEVYAFSSQPRFGDALRERFCALGETSDPGAAPPPLYEYDGGEAARHLFAVGAGLDSLILGENQIKQQIQGAWELSQREGATGPDLQRLIDAAHRCGKRIRTETVLNVGTLCVGKAAVLRGEEALGGLAGRVCLVLGTGKVGRMAARAIAERGPARLLLVNRTRAHAEALAAELADLLAAEAYAIDDLHVLLPDVDLVLGAAYAPELLLTEVAYTEATRTGRPAQVCMIDAAVPRILDPTLAELPGVAVADIEHMTTVVEANRARRTEAARQAWQIVEEEIGRYRAAVQAAELAPVIRRLTGEFDRIFAEEAAEFDVASPREQATREQARLRRLKQRLLHEAIGQIKALSDGIARD